jgi:hypothetical protein
MAGGRNFSNPGKAGATSFGMASENFGYSAVRLKRVKKLQFGVINPDELVSFVKCNRIATIYLNVAFGISVSQL